MNVGLNCDMGESFGLYKMGEDEAIMPFITQANVACGFHGSDPNHMRKTVMLAKAFGVGVGAHFSLPDLPGFGRREMKIEREEMTNIIVYQIGALKGFLDLEGMSLTHLKPHGALYGMAALQAHIAEAVADAAKLYDLPVMGLAGTLHESVYNANGVEFLAEFFADLDYGDDGSLIITREHEAVDPAVAATKVVEAIQEGTTTSVSGKKVPVRAETVCIHSDTPNSVDIAKAVKRALNGLTAA